ncbi:hypothetical protein EMCRGX_G019231 [Ephydatia muelleri]
MGGPPPPPPKGTREWDRDGSLTMSQSAYTLTTSPSLSGRPSIQRQSTDPSSSTVTSPPPLPERPRVHPKPSAVPPVSRPATVSPTPTPTPTLPRTSNQTLEEQDWYWGSISKEEATNHMKDAPEGSFLVRDAARVSGYYTLTLKKGGVNRLIRIIHRDGLYGFAEPLEFSSVVDLINFYRENTMAPYSPKLDITLVKGLSRRELLGQPDQDENNEDMVVEGLQEIEKQLREKNKKYNELQQQCTTTNEEIKALRLNLEAQKFVVSMMEEHASDQEKHHPYITGQDKIILMQNFDQLRRRIKLQKDMLQEIQDAVRRKEIDKNFKESDINNLKPEIKLLQTEKGTKLRWLNQRGWDQTRLNDILEMANTDEDGNQDEALYATYAMLHTYREENNGIPMVSIEEEGRVEVQTNFYTSKVKFSLSAHKTFNSHEELDLESTLSTSTLARFSAGGKNGGRPQPPLPKPPQDPLVDDMSVQSFAMLNYRQLNLPPSWPHFEQETWLCASITREQSKSLLENKPDGTFLVRPKENYNNELPTTQEPIHCYTIDIIDDGKFKRIPVFRGPGGGFGFAAPFEFDSLLTLVLYYSINTLEKHNPGLLRAALKFPACTRR